MVETSARLRGGELLALRLAGQELVAFRDSEHGVHVLDAHCPHLGTHLAHGGAVEQGQLCCPYDGWRFDADGRCVEAPGHPGPLPAARLRAWPVVERDGLVFVFSEPDRARTPRPELAEPAPERGTSSSLVEWKGLRTQPREVLETMVDPARIGGVDRGRDPRVRGQPSREGGALSLEFTYTLAGEDLALASPRVSVVERVVLQGPGRARLELRVGDGLARACLRLYPTPVDDERIDLRGLVEVEAQGDPQAAERVADALGRALTARIDRLVPIWEHRRSVAEPVVGPGPDPLAAFRRWSAGHHASADAAPSEPAASSEASRPSPAAPDARPSAVAAVLRAVPALRERARASAQTLVTRAPWLADLVEPVVGAELRDSSGPGAADPGAKATGPAPARAASSPDDAAAPVARVASIQEYVDSLPDRFVAAAGRGIHVVYQWELSGVGGKTFHAIVNDGTLEVVDGSHPRPTTTLMLSADDYIRAINGELDAMKLYSLGQAKFAGSIKAAMKMRALFPT